jgi:putative endopeptidase
LATNLPKAFFDENFAFFGKTLQGQKGTTPRWKQCTAMTDGALGEAVGQDWVKQNFPPAAKASMDKLVPRSKSPGRRHQDAALDERRHQEGRRREAEPDPQQDRLSREVARLLRAQVKRDDLIGNVTANASSSATTTSASWASPSTRRSGA